MPCACGVSVLLGFFVLKKVKVFFLFLLIVFWVFKPAKNIVFIMLRGMFNCLYCQNHIIFFGE